MVSENSLRINALRLLNDTNRSMDNLRTGGIMRSLFLVLSFFSFGILSINAAPLDLTIVGKGLLPLESPSGDIENPEVTYRSHGKLLQDPTKNTRATVFEARYDTNGHRIGTYLREISERDLIREGQIYTPIQLLESEWSKGSGDE